MIKPWEKINSRRPISWMPKTILYLTRHGSTLLNEGSRFRGSSDVPLSDLGRDQARNIHRILQSHKIEAIITSPRPRAIETAEIVISGHLDGTGKQIQPKVVKGLDSVFYGPWEGKTLEECEAMDPEKMKTFREHISELDMGGEKLEDLAKRSIAELVQLCEENPGKEVVAVTHQICTRTIICSLLNAPLDSYWSVGQDAACINILEYHGKGKFHVRVVNYVEGIFDHVSEETKAW
ncbi:putative alpha-ribazole phosphatase [Blattamonas nauphoetae]|uniref:Alpha-ribazole phosphatase n=1 Tax=Blattamonas nauphoetae TaxID=2049346 RepID=A0ABQ9YEP3_9EUKA|nr:putative alpha-ribazole phosphatase [Blattamonas nauphoetae]